MTSSKVRKPFPIHHVNSWRMHRQFLDHPFPSKTILEMIRAIGWIYSPGCSTPYLSLWSRSSSFKAGDLDKLVFEDKKLIQLETLRGCTMLVPRDQASVALRIRTRTFTELSKQARQQMPISDPDMEKLKTALLNALHSGHKTLEQLARLVPGNLVKDFGPDLKRIGLTNSLTLAINLLREEGKVLKQQGKKRLDSTEYSFVLTSNVVPEADPYNLRMEEACAQLAAQYFRAEAPARVKDFAWWAGLMAGDARTALAAVRSRLDSYQDGSRTFWFPDNEPPPTGRSATPPQVDLIQCFDELIISYSESRDMLHTEDVSFRTPLNTDGYRHVVVLEGRLLGHWRVNGAGQPASIETRLARQLEPSESPLLAEAVESYRIFATSSD